MVFTYLRPFLETVTHVDVSTLSLILLIIGVADFVGTLLIGMLVKEWLYKTLVVIPILMAAIAIFLIPLGSFTIATTLLLGVWGFLGTSAPVGWWTWLARTLPKNAETGGGLMVAIIQLTIMLGSTTGGILYDKLGYYVTFGVSAIILLIAASLSALAAARSKAATNPIKSSNHSPVQGAEK
ncbi:Purine ribonucleoside efflux pump NepI [Entomobacter blattae]|uniref:Purine ribonucleoside efflux pump NepI n=2 Tax=Entomobacter blattae TaxID=2762277 RepID=A0A7H1NNV2_9PROT|nr:MFS transporter [Entomobacter blattae]QNT77462.1 Purine ribonucleoside efflux pump NepI [Entomobacter blattae]